MNRKDAFNLLKENLKNKNLIKHSLAVEAGMKGLAQHFDKNEELWGICGLLHDIDYEITKDDTNLHSKKGAEILKKEGFNEKFCDAVLAHNEAHGIPPQGLMAKSLFCIDSLTGLIVAATLVLPSKEIKDLKVENALNRFKEERFAQGVSRKNIKKCKEYLNLSLKELIEIVLLSMQNISEDLEL